VKARPIRISEPVPGVEREQLHLRPFGQIRRLVDHQPPALHARLQGHGESLLRKRRIDWKTKGWEASIDGFPPELVFPAYAKNQAEFTCELDDEWDVMTLLRLVFHET